MSFLHFIIDWQPAPANPAGAARVSIDTFQAVKAFAARCKLSRIQAGNANDQRVMNDEHYSALLSDFSLNPAHGRSYAEAEQQALNPGVAEMKE